MGHIGCNLGSGEHLRRLSNLLRDDTPHVVDVVGYIMDRLAPGFAVDAGWCCGWAPV